MILTSSCRLILNTIKNTNFSHLHPNAELVQREIFDSIFYRQRRLEDALIVQLGSKKLETCFSRLSYDLKNPYKNERSCFEYQRYIHMNRDFKDLLKYRVFYELKNLNIEKYNILLEINYKNEDAINEVQNFLQIAKKYHKNHEIFEIIPLSFSVNFFVTLTKIFFSDLNPLNIINNISNNLKDDLELILIDIKYLCEQITDHAVEIQDSNELLIDLWQTLNNLSSACIYVFGRAFLESFGNYRVKAMILRYFNSYAMLMRSFSITLDILSNNCDADKLYTKLVLLNSNRFISHLKDDLIVNDDPETILRKILDFKLEKGNAFDGSVIS
jgi:hypothetical protein